MFVLNIVSVHFNFFSTTFLCIAAFINEDSGEAMQSNSTGWEPAGQRKSKWLLL